MTKAFRGAVVFSLLLAVGDGSATTYVRQPTMRDLAQVWIGTEPKGILKFLRLELDESGAGVLAIQYLPHHPAVAYRVRSTTLARYDVRFELEPLERDAEPIYLRGQAIPGTLDLEVGGTDGRWKRPVFLQVESAFMARLKSVTDAAAKWRRRSQ